MRVYILTHSRLQRQNIVDDCGVSVKGTFISASAIAPRGVVRKTLSSEPRAVSSERHYPLNPARKSGARFDISMPAVAEGCA